MQESRCIQIFLFLTITAVLISLMRPHRGYSEAQIHSPEVSNPTNASTYPDPAGRDAIRLWTEKENQREINEAIRRYWNYWNSRQRSRYSAYRLWYDLEQTQRWLDDPDHNPPPPPPPEPPGRFMPYPYPPPYPYLYYPPPWAYSPWRYPSYGYPSPYHWKKK